VIDVVARGLMSRVAGRKSCDAFRLEARPPPRDCERVGELSLAGNRKALATLFQQRSGRSEGIAMINLSLKRYLPAWFRSETGDFYLTIFFTAVATAELTYWCLSLPLTPA
jgi:hypothetical protein